MIAQIFPEVLQWYQSLPVLGPLMDSFAAWLHDLQACHRLFRRKFPGEESSVLVLRRFFCERGWLRPAAAPEPSRTEIQK